jgi:hypothetical protein
MGLCGACAGRVRGVCGACAGRVRAAGRGVCGLLGVACAGCWAWHAHVVAHDLVVDAGDDVILLQQRRDGGGDIADDHAGSALWHLQVAAEALVAQLEALERQLGQASVDVAVLLEAVQEVAQHEHGDDVPDAVAAQGLEGDTHLGLGLG